MHEDNAFAQDDRQSKIKPILMDKGASKPSGHFILILDRGRSVGPAVRKVSKLVREVEFAAAHHQKFLELTDREKEIITLLAEGKSSPEISETLSISRHTVNTHRKNIARKLDINSFAELLKFANAFNLVRY